MKKIALPIKKLLMQAYFEGEPLSTKIPDPTFVVGGYGQPIKISPTHASYDMLNWYAILRADTPAKYMDGSHDLAIQPESEGPVWIDQRAAPCGECHGMTLQSGWQLVTPKEIPDVVMMCPNCGYYNWYYLLDGTLELRLSGPYVVLAVEPLSEVPYV